MTTPENIRKRQRIEIGLLFLANLLVVCGLIVALFVLNPRAEQNHQDIHGLTQRLCHDTNAGRRQSNQRAPLERDEAHTALLVSIIVHDFKLNTHGIHLNPVRIRHELGLVGRVPITNCHQ